MNYRKGFAPIIIAVIIASTLLTSGSGYAGVRYSQSVKYSKEADRLFEKGEYKQALALYSKSLSRWRRMEVEKKEGIAIREEGISSSIEELRKNSEQVGWQECINRLSNIPADSRLYSEAQSVSDECQTKLNADTAAKKKAGEEALTKKNSTTATSQKSTPAAQGSSTSSDTAPSNESTPSSSSETTATAPSTSSTNTVAASCASNTSPTFTSHITDLSKVESIAIPPRIMGVGGHLKTHSYINSNHERVPVYAPVTMTLYGGVHLSHGSDPDDYGMDFKASCEVMVRVGHITDPIQSIKDTFPTATVSSQTITNITPIDFASGDLLGYTTGTAAAGNWDYGVYNSSTSNRYADDPDWNNSSIYTTAVCPYDYFTPSLKSAYTEKYITEFGISIPDGEFFCQ